MTSNKSSSQTKKQRNRWHDAKKVEEILNLLEIITIFAAENEPKLPFGAVKTT